MIGTSSLSSSYPYLHIPLSISTTSTTTITSTTIKQEPDRDRVIEAETHKSDALRQNIADKKGDSDDIVTTSATSSTDNDNHNTKNNNSKENRNAYHNQNNISNSCNLLRVENHDNIRTNAVDDNIKKNTTNVTNEKNAKNRSSLLPYPESKTESGILNLKEGEEKKKNARNPTHYFNADDLLRQIDSTSIWIWNANQFEIHRKQYSKCLKIKKEKLEDDIAKERETIYRKNNGPMVNSKMALDLFQKFLTRVENILVSIIGNDLTRGDDKESREDKENKQERKNSYSICKYDCNTVKDALKYLKIIRMGNKLVIRSRPKIVSSLLSPSQDIVNNENVKNVAQEQANDCTEPKHNNEAGTLNKANKYTNVQGDIITHKEEAIPQKTFMDLESPQIYDPPSLSKTDYLINREIRVYMEYRVLPASYAWLKSLEQSLIDHLTFYYLLMEKYFLWKSLKEIPEEDKSIKERKKKGVGTRGIEEISSFLSVEGESDGEEYEEDDDDESIEKSEEEKTGKVIDTKKISEMFSYLIHDLKIHNKNSATTKNKNNCKAEDQEENNNLSSKQLMLWSLFSCFSQVSDYLIDSATCNAEERREEILPLLLNDLKSATHNEERGCFNGEKKSLKTVAEFLTLPSLSIIRPNAEEMEKINKKFSSKTQVFENDILSMHHTYVSSLLCLNIGFDVYKDYLCIVHELILYIHWIFNIPHEDKKYKLTKSLMSRFQNNGAFFAPIGKFEARYGKHGVKKTFDESNSEETSVKFGEKSIESEQHPRKKHKSLRNNNYALLTKENLKADSHADGASILDKEIQIQTFINRSIDILSVNL